MLMLMLMMMMKKSKRKIALLYFYKTSDAPETNTLENRLVKFAFVVFKLRSELRAGVNIVVVIPGRFIDHLQQGNTSISRISFVVLDEADRMFDMGFEPQIKEVSILHKTRYTLCFSALPHTLSTLVFPELYMSCN
ncbi:hypothetical protein GIB67_032043 [Kingdonia uniflora]|uniref:Helicase ATP-binding domain-containing protein n=1 Tax=Kingdonia uniflora TaxID=39325 RepID=A0A7J7MWW7_9MAGN|nr:hypothetical protein GIB67_032043 [Kingdonia uniflora]